MKTYEVNYHTHGKPREKKAFVNLLPCPFCGSVRLEACNTHTPSFWVECLDCDGQAHGEHRPKSYIAALKSAVVAWNRRDSESVDRGSAKEE